MSRTGGSIPQVTVSENASVYFDYIFSGSSDVTHALKEKTMKKKRSRCITETTKAFRSSIRKVASVSFFTAASFGLFLGQGGQSAKANLVI
jgi:hypothetical protein